MASVPSLATWEIHCSAFPTSLELVPDSTLSSIPIDTTYHGYYSTTRQTQVHIPLLQKFLNETKTDVLTASMGISEALSSTAIARDATFLASAYTSAPTLILTAGAMGSGHTHVLNKWLRQYPRHFPDDLVRNDPDLFKSQLPEAEAFAREDAFTASTRLHKESCYLSERLLWECLHRGRTTVLEGTLKDAVWHTQLIARIRLRYPYYRIVILHVLAEAHVIRMRTQKRCQATGRCIPSHILDDAIQQVPLAVHALRDIVDDVIVVDNSMDDVTSEHKDDDGNNIETDRWSMEDFMKMTDLLRVGDSHALLADEHICIHGLEKAEVLMTLYNNAELSARNHITIEQARQICFRKAAANGGLHFDNFNAHRYLEDGTEHGWPRMKLRLGTDLLDVSRYNEHCGPVKAAVALRSLLQQRLLNLRRQLTPSSLTSVERMFGCVANRELPHLPSRELLSLEHNHLVSMLHLHLRCEHLEKQLTETAAALVEQRHEQQSQHARIADMPLPQRHCCHIM